MPKCKNYDSERTIKNGIVRGKQRFRCKECGFNFVE
jgi:transposase-like protein